MTTWADLSEELDRWAAAGRVARFWWRDDDATACTPALERLIGAARATGAPLAIAVIPSLAQDDLLSRDDWPEGVALVQHGFSHANHAPAGEKKAEFGEHRPEAAMLEEIARGWSILSRIGNAVAAFVPPWNRVAERLISRLPDVGLSAVSTYGPRRKANPAAGMLQANTHVDPIDWHGSRGYRGDADVLGQTVKHLALRRNGEVDADEATGVLTHHLVHDEGCWRFIETFAETVSRHPSAMWATPREVFCP